MSLIIAPANVPNIPSGEAAVYCNAVNQYIESVTGRSWGVVETVSEEVHDYESVIFLSHMDVTELTEVKVLDQVIPATDYVWSKDGRLVLSTRPSGFRPSYGSVKVTYKHGRASAPADLVLAGIALANRFYNYVDEGGAELTSEGVGSMRYTYATGKDSATGKTFFDVIEKYRKLTV